MTDSDIDDKSVGMADSDMDEESKKNQVKKWQRFAENVSIAGLLDMYNAPSPLIRFMWILALTCAAGSIVFHTCELMKTYYAMSIPFDVVHTDAQAIPFPDVTLCTSTDMNYTRVMQRIVVPEHVQKKIAKLSADDREAFLNAIAIHASTSMEGLREGNFTAFLDPYSKNMRDAVASTLATFITYSDDPVWWKCEDIVLACAFNGKPYDCCKDSVTKLSEGSMCFEFPMQTVDAFAGYARYPNRPTTLEMHLTFDWKHAMFYANDDIDGYYLHISDPVSFFNHPVAIAGGMHSTVKIAKALKRIDKTGCLKDDELPVLLTGPYDGRGYNCKVQQFLDVVVMKYVGCKVPFGSYMPDFNTLCDSSMGMVLKNLVAVGGGTPQSGKQLRSDMRSAYYDSRCLPRCAAWEYEANPSYSLLMQSTEGLRDGNESTTKVTVVLPSAFYEEHTEKDPAPFYDTFVSICYTFSLYAGCSVITLAEILYYATEIAVSMYSLNAANSKHCGREQQECL